VSDGIILEHFLQVVVMMAGLYSGSIKDISLSQGVRIYSTMPIVEERECLQLKKISKIKIKLKIKLKLEKTGRLKKFGETIKVS